MQIKSPETVLFGAFYRLQLLALLALLLISGASNSCTVAPRPLGYHFSQKMTLSSEILIVELDASDKNQSIRLVEVLRGDKAVLAKIDLNLAPSVKKRDTIHADLAFWLGRKSASVVTPDCVIHHPIYGVNNYILMARGSNLISLEAFESTEDPWPKFVRKNLSIPAAMAIPEDIFLAALVSHEMVNCARQETPSLSVSQSLTLARICANTAREYLLLSAGELDIFIPVEQCFASGESNVRERNGS